jgi:hypothetical protein
MTERAHAGSLRRLVEGAVLFAVGASASGCCEVLSLGWARSYGGRSWRAVERLTPGTARGAHPRWDGRFDLATCKDLCRSAEDGAHATGCVAATFERASSAPGSPDAPLARGSSGDVIDPAALFVVCDFETAGGCRDHIPSGRLPSGIVLPPPRPDESVGDVLARQAQLEAASQHAFRLLALDLHAHGAPARLTRRARQAASDEARHARAVGALARRHGRRAPAVAPPRHHARALLAIALENAVEGCVGETLGAAVAVLQARVARDPAIRRALRAVAKDELRHASLAWAVHGWCEMRLDAGDRAVVRAALERAATRVTHRPPAVSPQVSAITGLPALERSRVLACALAERVWSVT